jgi:hypothetical protein
VSAARLCSRCCLFSLPCGWWVEGCSPLKFEITRALSAMRETFFVKLTICACVPSVVWRVVAWLCPRRVPPCERLNRRFCCACCVTTVVDEEQKKEIKRVLTTYDRMLLVSGTSRSVCRLRVRVCPARVSPCLHVSARHAVSLSLCALQTRVGASRRSSAARQRALATRSLTVRVCLPCVLGVETASAHNVTGCGSQQAARRGAACVSGVSAARVRPW